MKKTTRLLAVLCALMLLCACTQADDLYATETGYTSAPSDGEYNLLMWQSQESENGLVVSVDAACALMHGNKAVWERRYGGDGEDELCWAVPGDGVWTAAGSSASCGSRTTICSLRRSGRSLRSLRPVSSWPR